MINLDAIRPATFDFELNGKTYSIPSLDGLDVAPILDIIEGDAPLTQSVFSALFRRVMREHAPDALDGLNVAQFKALMDAYGTTGNVGESSPSSD